MQAYEFMRPMRLRSTAVSKAGTRSRGPYSERQCSKSPCGGGELSGPDRGWLYDDSHFGDRRTNGGAHRSLSNSLTCTDSVSVFINYVLPGEVNTASELEATWSLLCLLCPDPRPFPK